MSDPHDEKLPAYCSVLPNGTILSTRPPVAWIDTNVLLEVYTFADLRQAVRAPAGADPETRRLRLQGTLWFVTVLCLQQALTVSYSHEGLRNLERMCPPGSEQRAWSAAIAFILGEGGVFDGWVGATTSAGAELSNPQRDSLMIEACRQSGMVLVTRDVKAAEKAQVHNVNAETPERYAARVMPRSLAERHFVERLEGATSRYIEAGTDDQREDRRRTTLLVRKTYDFIWKPDGPAPPFSAEAMFRRQGH